MSSRARRRPTGGRTILTLTPEAWDVAAAWVVLASVAAFAACLLDKAWAVRRRARIPERVLLGLALAGGSPGLLLGMLVARHKTRKASFLVSFALIVLAQVAVVAWVLRSPL